MGADDDPPRAGTGYLEGEAPPAVDPARGRRSRRRLRPQPQEAGLVLGGDREELGSSFVRARSVHLHDVAIEGERVGFGGWRAKR
jgi:hypothetical protein